MGETYTIRLAAFLRKHGISTTTDISKGTGIPMHRAYPALLSLSKSGTVIKHSFGQGSRPVEWEINAALGDSQPPRDGV